MKKSNILIVDDDSDVLETARMFLKQEFASVDIEENPEKIPGYFDIKDYDVILLDMNFKRGVNDGEEGFKWLQKILELDPNAIVILITAYGEVDLAVKAMKLGATDFVLKPWKNQKLLATILSAIKHRESQKQISRLKASQAVHTDALDKIIGKSDEMVRLKELITKVANTDASVLILGENGTGKELVAKALHAHSNRSNELFVGVDLGAISETLFESELFGHIKGSFTDAKTDRPGQFEIADNGTIFLDEIGNLSLPLQAKLLTILQNKVVRRVGSNKDISIDFRLICATNMAVHKMVDEKSFRQDLLYRINTVEIKIPALRERPEDIPLLINHFLKQFSKKYNKKLPSVSDIVLSRLKTYEWPGNVRELAHATERAVILSDEHIIDDDSLFINENTSKISLVTKTAKTLDEMEKQFIQKSLKENEGNVSKTAKKLGLTRTAMYRRLNKYGLN